jgi:hypothetical protein
MAGWIFIDKESEGGEIRQQMRRNMRSGSYHGGMNYRNYGNGSNYRDGYRQGYKEGWEDHEDEMDDMEYRRSRDSRNRLV